MISPALAALLDRLPPADQLDFSRLLDAIDAVRFSGTMTIDFLNGRARQINLGQPIKLTICAESRNGAHNPVDKGPATKAG